VSVCSGSDLTWCAGQSQGNDAAKKLSVKRKYDFFGEHALVSEGLRWSTTMRAGEAGCLLLVLKHDGWDTVRVEFPEVHKRLTKLWMSTMGERLTGISVFNGIPSSKLSVLSHLFSYHRVHKGSIVCREGSFGDSMYIIAEGIVKIIAEGVWRCGCGGGVVVRDPHAVSRALPLPCCFPVLLPKGTTSARRMFVARASSSNLAAPLIAGAAVGSLFTTTSSSTLRARRR